MRTLLVLFLGSMLLGCSSLTGKTTSDRNLSLITEDCKKLELNIELDSDEHNQAEKSGQIPTGLLSGSE